jgi:hypothetical protein
MGGTIDHPQFGDNFADKPWQKSRTTELSETTMPGALVSALYKRVKILAN